MQSPLITSILEGKDAKGRWVCAFYACGTENVFGFLLPGRRAEAQAFIDYLGRDPCTVSEHELHRAYRLFRDEQKALKLAANRGPTDGPTAPSAAKP